MLRLRRNLHIKRRCPGDARVSDPLASSSAAHSTQMLPAERRCPADARAYIRPLGKQQAPRTVRMEVHKVLSLPRDLRTEVHKVLRLPRNLHMKVHKVLRLPRNLHIQRRCPADARAYIRPLGKQQAPRTVHMGTRRFTKYCACHEICT